MSDAYSKLLQLGKLAQGAATKSQATIAAKARRPRGKGPATGAVTRLEKLWFGWHAKYRPGVTPARWWVEIEDTGKGKPLKAAGLVNKLCTMYSAEQVRHYLRWAVLSWGEVSEHVHDVAIPADPSIEFLFGFRQTLLPAALGSDSRRA